MVNTPSALGGIGGTTALQPALTLGCGAAGSASAADIILPTMLATAFSSVLGVLLVKLFIPAGKRKEKKKSLAATRLKKAKTQGAGQRP